MTKSQELFAATHETGHYIVCKVLIKNRRTVLLAIANLEGLYGVHRFTGPIVTEKKDRLNEIAEILGGLVATNLYCKELGEYGARQDKNEAEKMAKNFALDYNWKYRKFRKFTKRVVLEKLLGIKILNNFERKIWERDYKKVLKKAQRLAEETIVKNEAAFKIVLAKLVERKQLTGEELDETLRKNNIVL